MKMSKIALLGLVGIFFTGCVSLTAPAPTHVELPSGEELRVQTDWYKAYSDERLDSFVEMALEHNKDLQIAAANVALASAQLNLTTAQRFPELSLQGSGVRGHTSEQSTNVRYDQFSVSGVLSYELDLWGRLQKSSESAKSSLLQTRANQESIKLSLISSVVDSYFAIVALNEQKSIAKESLAIREKSYEIMRSQGEYGLVSEYEVLQSESLVSAARMSLENIDSSLIKQMSAFKILLGQTPTELYDDEVQVQVHILPDAIEVPEGIPSNLMEQRADIQAALYGLYAANANIHVAKTAYFPTISLSGLLGVESDQFRNLMRSSASVWSVGGSLAMPILDFGRTSSRVEQSEASQEIARLNYEATVYKAFSEVHSAFLMRSSVKALQLQYETQLAINERLAELAKVRYEQGLSDFLSVLDANRNLLDAQLSLISAKQAVLSNDITLIKSLGGGWEGFKEEE